MFYGGREIGVSGVRGIVKRLLKQASTPVIIQADQQVAIERYTEVHDAAALAGAERIHLATLKP